MSRRTPLRTIPALVLAGALALTLAPGSPAASAAPQPAAAGQTTAVTGGGALAPGSVAAGAVADRKKPKKKKHKKKKARKKRAAASAPATGATSAGSLSYGPRTYVGGQALTFSGRLPAGRRSITMQQHMGRPGDTWFAVPGFAGTTAADGSFRFQWPAPDMMNIRFRVVSAGLATPSVPLVSKSNSVDLWVDGQARSTGSRYPFTVASGRTFSITADTSPAIPGRSTAHGTPVFPGRVLTLQKRTSPTTWAAVKQTTTGSDGLGRFGGLTAAAPTVYRVRQEAVTSGANRIGWYASAPMYVNVSGGSRVASERVAADPWAGLRATSTGTTAGARSGGASRTASSTYKWGQMLYDFAWELGEAIDSTPKRGSGSWAEYSDGAGRVTRQNGQLTLESKREGSRGNGDFGTTMATMRGNDRAYGRWEQRLRLRSNETGAPGGDYAVRLELVPASNPYDSCRRILVGEFKPHSGTMTFAARNGRTQWAGSRSVGSLTGSSPAIAVEVMPGHVTWFFNGTPIGTVNSSAVTSGVPLTLRMSMVDNGNLEMNQASAYSDWQRGHSHTTSRAVNGPALRAAGVSGCG